MGLLKELDFWLPRGFWPRVLILWGVFPLPAYILVLIVGAVNGEPDSWGDAIGLVMLLMFSVFCLALANAWMAPRLTVNGRGWTRLRRVGAGGLGNGVGSLLLMAGFMLVSQEFRDDFLDMFFTATTLALLFALVGCLSAAFTREPLRVEPPPVLPRLESRPGP